MNYSHAKLTQPLALQSKIKNSSEFHNRFMYFLFDFCLLVFVCFILPESKPTMSMMTSLTAKNGEKINIMLTLSQDWEQVGDLLDFDDQGITVSNIHMKKSLQGNVACLKEVLQLWMGGKSRNCRYRNPTWESFIHLLTDMNHEVLATDLKRIV